MSWMKLIKNVVMKRMAQTSTQGGSGAADQPELTAQQLKPLDIKSSVQDRRKRRGFLRTIATEMLGGDRGSLG